MNLRTSHFITSVLLGTLSHALYAAPAIDVTLKVGQWQGDYSGDLGQGIATATLQELGFDQEDHSVVSLTIEHILPALPNIKIQHTDLSSSASGTLSRNLVIDGTTFTFSDTVSTQLDLTHTDLTFFYSPIDNWVHTDIGLTARRFNGDLSIAGTGANEAINLNEWVPMLYGNLRFDLPLTGIYINTDVNYISYDDNTLTDYSASLGYVSNSSIGFTAELGYRRFSIDAEDINGFEADIDIDGMYVAVGLVF